MNPLWLLVVAVLLLPLALATGVFGGVSLVGVFLVGAYIVSCVKRAGAES